jgi:hypothetical protein
VVFVEGLIKNMFGLGLRLNPNGVPEKMGKLIRTSQIMTSKVSLKTGQKCISNLQRFSPKGGTGDLDLNFRTRLVAFRYTHRCWVSNASPYYYYANYGNGVLPIKPKRRKALRWFAPNSGTAANYMSSNVTGDGRQDTMGKVFSMKSAPMYSKNPEGKYFKEKATFMTRVDHRKIAEQEIGMWLK